MTPGAGFRGRPERVNEAGEARFIQWFAHREEWGTIFKVISNNFPATPILELCPVAIRFRGNHTGPDGLVSPGAERMERFNAGCLEHNLIRSGGEIS